MLKSCIRSDYNENDLLITIMVIDICNFQCPYCIETLHNMPNVKYIDLYTNFSASIDKYEKLLSLGI